MRRRRYKNQIQQAMYDLYVGFYMDTKAPLFNEKGERSDTGSARVSAFWRGFDATEAPRTGRDYSVTRSCFMAGWDCASWEMR